MKRAGWHGDGISADFRGKAAACDVSRSVLTPGLSLSMIDVDWSEWWLTSIMAASFLVVGAVSGFRSGVRGQSLQHSFLPAVRATVCFVVLASTLVAVVLAYYWLWDLGSDEKSNQLHRYSSYITARPEGAIHGLALDYQGYWIDLNYGCDFHYWCSCARCTPRSPFELDEIVNRAIGNGAAWAFLAPVWMLFGLVPTLAAAGVAHPFGLRKRERQALPPR
ncbi:hypothetical protein [Haloferula rosea]|uniref:Uncharacterized protein n=1 Tax=Haloferula rosea TaxID=490093 RepID=A0A934VGX9_9BACT|nr:hypothetical protein [Haloferula rosea]MBK1828511.1 hypothetical protein [Haloferula rosea]